MEIGFYYVADIKVKSVSNIRHQLAIQQLFLDIVIKFSWSFKHDDLRKAVLSLLVNDDLQSDQYVIPMVLLIIEQFENEHEMFDWTKDIFEKVTFLTEKVRILREPKFKWRLP